MLSFKSSLLLGSSLALLIVEPTRAQDAEREGPAGDIIVTAQRIEQRLQDVPISITVLDQQTLANNNITSARDLTSVTPGLTMNSRYGNDATTFTIRGFTQELRTPTTVGVYFADVVVPRGGANQGGDGAGPGALFDLQNIQVLKGPQGTLFGRNTSGGAVLLVPVKPKDQFEGYIEGSLGKLDLRRIQAVVNVPVMDSLRIRIGVDRNKRDGYLKNLTKVGPKRFGDVDYTTLRFSAVADLSDTVENYTVVSYIDSNNNGSIPSVKECSPGVSFAGIPTGNACVAQVSRDSASGFWTVENVNPYARSTLEQWQVINTTTWQVSDNFTIKNNFAYGEFRAENLLDFFGNVVLNPGVSFDQLTGPSQGKGFVLTITDPVFNRTSAQSSLVEELQFQGNMADGRFTWQAGLYYEKNGSLGPVPYMTPQFTPCADAKNFNCTPATPGVSLGSASYQNNEINYEGYAAYVQASYALTDQLKLTGGFRYTKDKVNSPAEIGTISFRADGNHQLTCTNATAPGSTLPKTPTSYLNRRNYCREVLRTSSDAPTWTIGVDYKPIPDVLLYAKWTRGYRQGGVNPAGPATAQRFRPEKVDTYEAGTKATWHGPIPGSFNLSAYYNDFRNQQLQLGIACRNGGCSPTAAIVNAGKSRMYGFESELNLRPFEGLRLDVSYAYLNSKLTEIVQVQLPPGSIYDEIRTIPVGNQLPLAMPHKVTASAIYTLPLAENIGRISVGGTFIYESRYKIIQATIEANSYLPGYKYGNVSANWEDVAGMPIDLSFYVTNVTNTKRYAHKNDQLTRGFTSYFLHEPRLWGVRLKYRFGALAD